ncbi:MAG: hypothetical protein B6D56_07110 [Candidatus Omnitrophica bacterium 4484_70.1]|nr:MAG: hypothetical protein B6D56_07110 [Candidatus Omnitrophica bacterium 4484_70.1]
MKNYKYAIGIGVNLFDARAILLREDGEVIRRVEKPRKDVNANRTIAIFSELFTEILDQSKEYQSYICGVGLALGGVVDKKEGVVYWPQREDTHYVYISIPLKSYLEEKFKLPIVLENDANAAAYAEYLLNVTHYKNLIYMFSGVGCGIIINGELYRGSRGMAGELFVNPYHSTSCSLGDFSFFTQWPADLKVPQRAKELISLGKESSLIKKITPTGELSLEDIFEEAGKKDEVSIKILREAGFSLGVKLAILINLLNPEVVIIGGEFERAGDFFLEEVRRAIKCFSFSEIVRELKILFSNLGREASSLGVGYLVFKENPLQR